MRFWQVFVVLIVLSLSSAAVLGQQPSFRMPEYAEGDIPPLRSQAEVERLLAGANPLAEDKPLRVVLVAGPKDHDIGEHDYPNWQKVWSRLLASDEQTEVDTAWEFPDERQIEAADVLVFYQRGRWNDERAAAIDPFLARGGGAVYIHWAVDGQGGEKEMAKRIGLASLGGSIGYRHGPLHVDFSHNPQHPIARNLTQVDWVDESYWRLRGDPSRISLLGTGVEEGEPRPLYWTVENGRGRVFVSIPGHYMWTFDDPIFRAILLRGIAWAGHRSVDRFNKLVTLDARVD
ncbi:ThuA domain-containing protein [Bythopirellula polymerisocia]|uniref:Trehalose utilization n=1 Tax=Bythopirellula polymerisocia TaxID=2528003 RepID=A0A5C6D425_9BACT|nr:ThuA domain-containing protein [Bythopirellula polymerisocia]TWU30541.1 Trehalose utilization [Bythopirellula polymerisocia]